MPVGAGVVPAPLVAGGRIAIVSPSGCIDPVLVDRGAEMLRRAGYDVVVGVHARSAHGRFAGTRAERLADLQAAFDDPLVRVVMCSRGGYGAVQLLRDLDLGGFMRSPKWVVGFSDITAIHALLQANGCASLHAPMLKHLVSCGWDDCCVRHLMEVLGGRGFEVACGAHPLNRLGEAVGVVRGGNLSVLAGLRGTWLDCVGEGTILFLEDVGERPYRIDRMLWNLELGGVFDRLAGLVVGQFTGYEDDLTMGCGVYDLIARMVRGRGYPVCFDFPVGHVDANEPVVCGVRARLSVDAAGAVLRQL